MTPYIHHNTLFYFSPKVNEKSGLYIPKHGGSKDLIFLLFHYTIALVRMPKLEHDGNSELKKFERTYPIHIDIKSLPFLCFFSKC